MTHDVPSAAQRRAWLGALVEAGHLDAVALPLALRALNAHPADLPWRRYAQWLLIGGGATLMALGVIFFVAYNWADLSRMHKFVLIQSALVVAAGCAAGLGLTREAGRAALGAAVLILGALLAFFGQTYQTGADPWQLFATWALLATPWIVLSRSAVLGCVWTLIVNVALWLWLGQAQGSSWREALMAAALLNFFLLIATRWMAAQGLLRDAPVVLWRLSAALVTLACVTLLCVESWQTRPGLWLTQSFFVLPWVLIGALLFWFDQRLPDVPTAAFAYSAAVIAVANVIASLMDKSVFVFVSFTLVALIVIGLTVLAVRRLQHVARRAHQPQEIAGATHGS